MNGEHKVGDRSGFPPLALETREVIPTSQAAYYLNRRPQTLRIWASAGGSGPIRPLRINGRLAWPTRRIRELVGAAE